MQVSKGPAEKLMKKNVCAIAKVKKKKSMLKVLPWTIAKGKSFCFSGKLKVVIYNK